MNDSPSEKALEYARAGASSQEQGRYDEAKEAYGKALDLFPGFSEVWNNLGVLHEERGELERARECFSRALTLQPEYPEAENNRGNLFKRQGNLQSAVESYERAIRWKPDYANARYNLGTVLLAMGRPAEAEQALRESLRLDPKQPRAWVNFGEAKMELGLLEEAFQCQEQALALDPGQAEARWNRAFIFLLRGDYERGWVEYESRWNLPDQRLRYSEKPRWQGESLQGKKILVYAEQGLGDTIQFARFLPLLKARGGEVWLQCQIPLVSFLEKADGVDRLFPLGSMDSGFDVQIPLQSLPLVLGIRLESIPPPCLRRDFNQVSSPLDQRQERSTRIAFCWSGSQVDLRRRCPLEQWAPLVKTPGTEWISFQTGDAAEELRRQFPSVEDWSGRLNDFLDTAKALKEVDLVICIDTALAHLAGVMGKPVWILLTKSPDWRWGMKREDSPWYPSTRLFRQETPGDWGEVVRRVEAELSKLHTKDTKVVVERSG